MPARPPRCWPMPACSVWPRPQTMAASGWASASRCRSPRRPAGCSCAFRCSNRCCSQGPSPATPQAGAISRRRTAGDHCLAGRARRRTGRSRQPWRATATGSWSRTVRTVPRWSRSPAPPSSLTRRSTRTSPQYWLRLDGARVVARLSSDACARLLDDARILLAGFVVGAAEGAIARTATHVATRVQFGRPLSAKQAVRHWMARMQLLTEASGAAVRRLLATDEVGAARDTRPTLSLAHRQRRIRAGEGHPPARWHGFHLGDAAAPFAARYPQDRRRVRRRRAGQADRPALDRIRLTEVRDDDTTGSGRARRADHRGGQRHRPRDREAARGARGHRRRSTI